MLPLTPRNPEDLTVIENQLSERSKRLSEREDIPKQWIDDIVEIVSLKQRRRILPRQTERKDLTETQGTTQALRTIGKVRKGKESRSYSKKEMT